MSNETEAGTHTHNSFSDTVDLGLIQALETDSQENESSTTKLALRSVDEWIEHAIGPTLSRVEETCALLSIRTEL